MENHQSEATKLLGFLRRSDNCFSIWLDGMRRKLAAGNLTLEDIGTTEAEIENCRVAGCKTAATKLLGYLRRSDYYYSIRLDGMRGELAAGNLTPEDIGTTEAEIASHKQVLT